MNLTASALNSIAVSSSRRASRFCTAGSLISSSVSRPTIRRFRTKFLSISELLWLYDTPKNWSKPTSSGPRFESSLKSGGTWSPQPRCHLPTAPVAYPSSWSIWGNVSRSSSISSGMCSSNTQFFIHVRQA